MPEFGNEKPIVKMPIEPFHYITREVSDLNRARKFYCELLAFQEGTRAPPFINRGFWLYGHGLHLQLQSSTVPMKALKQKDKVRYDKYSSGIAINTDYMTFFTSNIATMMNIFEEQKIDFQIFRPHEIQSLTQVLLFDPDGNAIVIAQYHAVKKEAEESTLFSWLPLICSY